MRRFVFSIINVSFISVCFLFFADAHTACGRAASAVFWELRFVEGHYRAAVCECPAPQISREQPKAAASVQVRFLEDRSSR
jgi:hypothetical protein